MEIDPDGWATRYVDHVTPLARIAGDLAAACADLDEVVGALDRLKASPPHDALARAAYYSYAVMMYARLFKKGRRHRIDHLLGEVIEGGPATAGDLHAGVIGYRDKHLAHVTSDLDRAGVLIEVQRRGTEMRRRMLPFSETVIAPTGPHIGQFRDLANALRTLLNMELESMDAPLQAEVAHLTSADLDVMPETRNGPRASADIDGWKKPRR